MGTKGNFIGVIELFRVLTVMVVITEIYNALELVKHTPKRSTVIPQYLRELFPGPLMDTKNPQMQKSLI